MNGGDTYSETTSPGSPSLPENAVTAYPMSPPRDSATNTFSRSAATAMQRLVL